MHFIVVLMTISVMHSQPIETEITGTIAVVSWCDAIWAAKSVRSDPAVRFNNVDWIIDPVYSIDPRDAFVRHYADKKEMMRQKGKTISITGKRRIKMHRPPLKGCIFIIEATKFEIDDK